MSTITILRPDVSTEEVSATLRDGLGPHYQVLPGMETRVLPGEPDPGSPDSIVVGTGSAHVFRTQLRVDRRGGQTRIRVAPARELVSLKVMRRSPAGHLWITSSSAVIRALT